MTLFPAPTVCRHCGASSDDPRHPRCEFEQQPDWGTQRRPRGCLNAYDPAEAEIPF